MSQRSEPTLKTTPARTAKMLVIVLGICIAGGAIFFSFWDYWISLPPGNQMHAAAPQPTGGGAATGKTIPVSLSFIESSDFKSYAFNALPGEEGHNPEIHASVGDKIEFTITNGGKSFHAFGVTAETEGTDVIPGTEVHTASNPLKPGEGGSSSFIPQKEGTYYYICTVPGHRELGMEGKIVVGPAQGGSSAPVKPTGNSESFDLTFIESADFKTYAFNALPGEDGHNPDLKVKAGDSVTIKAVNNGKSFHAFAIVTDPEDPTTVVFKSEIKSANNPMKPGESGEVTFVADTPGTYYYICAVPGHAALGMQGNFVVEP
ncbi:MAG TPA: cupredoxin domain-containing protein [Candidatus Nitrosotenuis sp.]|nr:cupredoxin domain-containing protein [Candidatus Nitrosotenuis sp.]